MTKKKILGKQSFLISEIKKFCKSCHSIFIDDLLCFVKNSKLIQDYCKIDEVENKLSPLIQQFLTSRRRHQFTNKTENHIECLATK